MSSHILHVLDTPARLQKYRGHLQLVKEDKVIKQIPFEDLKAVVLASLGVSLSGNVLSTLLEHKVIVVHCDKRFVPCGVTSPLVQMINPEILRQQVSHTNLKKAIWQQILWHKINNQKKVLELLGVDASYLKKALTKKALNESATAKEYFKQFFQSLGVKGLTRRNDDAHRLNIMLNYGYTIVQALVHRSLVAHGLNPVHGMHHIDRYQSDALVYDMIEPWRPFVDLMIWIFIDCSNSPSLENFKKYIAYSQHSWHNLRFNIQDKNWKMINAIDYMSSSLANTFLCQSTFTS